MHLRQICILVCSLTFAGGATAQSAEPTPMHQHPAAGLVTTPADAAKPGEQLITLPPDPRERVRFPPEVRHHTLANMRDHLTALQEIDEALGRADYQAAGKLAEERLGMSSMERHGAHQMAKFMPDGMQKIGTEMHHAASRFAIEAQTAAATGDVRPALAALGQVMHQCVACHTSYRVQ
jgi:hypothetical protein